MTIQKTQKPSFRKLADNKVDGVKRFNAYRVNIDLIHEEPGFNARDYNDPDVVEQINHYTHIYLEADRLYDIDPANNPNPGDVLGDWELRFGDDGETIFITDSHLRHKAALQAIELGTKHLIDVPITPDPSKSRLASMARVITSQDGLKLKPMDMARHYKRMMEEEGASEQEIADLVHKTVIHVKQNLSLLDMPEDLIELVNKGKIAANVAREMVAEYGPEQAVRLALVGADITQDAGKKITAKILDQAKEKIESTKPANNGEDVEMAAQQNTTQRITRQPAKRLSGKLVQELRIRTLDVTEKLLAQTKHIQLDDLADDDEVEIPVTLTKAELLAFADFKSRLASTEEESSNDENADADNQMSVWMPEKWKNFSYPASQTDYADLQDRFDRLMESMDASQVIKEEAWKWLQDNATENELINLRSMRAALQIAMGLGVEQ